MKNLNDDGGVAPVLAAERLAEIDELSRRIRKNLAEMLADADCAPGPTPKELQNKLNELHAAHLKVLAAEDAFHAKIGKNPDDDAVDFEAMRIDIGRQLDRIRASLVSGGFSGETDI